MNEQMPIPLGGATQTPRGFAPAFNNQRQQMPKPPMPEKRVPPPVMPTPPSPSKKRPWFTIIAVIVVVAVLLFVAFRNSGKTPSVSPVSETDPIVQLMATGSGKVTSQFPVSYYLNGAEMMVPNSSETVTLNDGEASFDTATGKGSIVLGDVYASHTVGDGVTDLFAVASVNLGEANVFQYLVIFKATEAGVEFRDSVLLGDRIKVSSINAPSSDKSDYAISVSGLTRQDFEPLTNAPSVGNKWDFFVSGHKFLSG